MVTCHLDLLVCATDDATDQPTENALTRKKHVAMTEEKLAIFKNMLSSGSNSVQIGAALSVSSRTVQRWAEAIDKDPSRSPMHRGRQKVRENPIWGQLEAIIASDCSLTGKGIVERLPEEMKRSQATVSRHIKAMGFTRKRLKPIVAARNSEWVITERHVYSLHMANTSDADLVFLDETGFNLHVCAGYGYAPISATPWITVPTQRGRNVSLIAAISFTGLLSYQIITGAFNTLKMTEWCTDNLLPALLGRRVTLVMDNARFHHAPIINDIVVASGSRIQFLPPYSPQLNPIEQVFACIKNRYRAHRPMPATQDELKEMIEIILVGLRSQSMATYYSNMREWLVKGQQRLPFV
jgi:transposase